MNNWGRPNRDRNTQMDKSSFNNERQLESLDIIWQLRSPHPLASWFMSFSSSHQLDLPTGPPTPYPFPLLQCLLWESIVYSVSIKGISGNIKSFSRQTMGRHKLAPPALLMVPGWPACVLPTTNKYRGMRIGECSVGKYLV